MISVKVDDDHEKQTADRTFDVMLSSDPPGADFIPRKTWSFTIPPSDLEVKRDSSMDPVRFRKGAAELRFTVDGLQNSKTFAVSSTDARIAVRTGLIPADADRNSFDVVLGLTEGAELEIKETIGFEISHLDAFSRDGAQISVGESHYCAIKAADNTVACAGDNTKGQGNLTNASHLGTIRGVSNRKFSAVSAGESHTCGILMDDGTIACWGDRASGKSTPTESPQKVEGTEKFFAVSAGDSHTCGIRIDNTIACWGNPADDRLDPTMSFQKGVTTATKFLAVSAGDSHTCGIRIDNTVACWGNPADDRLDPTMSFQKGVTTATKFLAVSTGVRHACGIRIDSTIVCWGYHVQNRLDLTQSYPGDVTEATKFLAVSAGLAHTCGIRIGNTLACWGIDPIGRNYSLAGGSINADDKFLAVSTEDVITCGIRIDNTSVCHNVIHPTSPPTPPIGKTEKAAVIPDTFYLFERQGMSVPAELQSAVRLRVKVFLEGALR